MTVWLGPTKASAPTALNASVVDENESATPAASRIEVLVWPYKEAVWVKSGFGACSVQFHTGLLGAR